jgi:tRNA G18 (ribose-2'-O)-methylase SpoU
LEKIYLCGITAKPPHREILKTALGATESVAWEYQPDTALLLDTIKTEGYQLLAVEQAAGSVFLQDFAIKSHQKIALIFGNEVDGVQDEVLAKVDAALEIPQFGTKHSLNVSVTIGIVVWELARQLKFMQ